MWRTPCQIWCSQSTVLSILLNLQFQLATDQFISTYIPLEKSSKAPLYTRLVNTIASVVECYHALIHCMPFLITTYRGALINRKLRKVDPYHPFEFARRAQEQFVRANEAIQK